MSWRRLTFHDIMIKRATNGGGVLAVILDGTSDPRRSVNSRAIVSSKVTSTTSSKSDTLFNWTDSRRTGLQEDSVEDDPARLDEPSELAEQNSADIGISSEGLRSDGVADASVAREGAGQIAKISISHDGEYATAVCLAAEELF